MTNTNTATPSHVSVPFFAAATKNTFSNSRPRIFIGVVLSVSMHAPHAPASPRNPRIWSSANPMLALFASYFPQMRFCLQNFARSQDDHTGVHHHRDVHLITPPALSADAQMVAQLLKTN